MSVFDYDLLDDLIVKYVTCSLSNKVNYFTKFNLESTRIEMTCGYNSRSKSRWVILKNSIGEIILPQTELKYDRRVELNFYAEQSDLDFYLTLKPKNIAKIPDDNYDYINWANDFDMCFVGYEYSITERLERNIRINLVGN